MVSVLWEFVPDPAALQRRRTLVRLVALAASVVLVWAGWISFGPPGGMVALVVMLIVNLTVHAWSRGLVVGGPQRVLLDDGVLVFEGPEVFVRTAGDDGFESVEADSISLAFADRVTVYPSTTRFDDGAAGLTQFHLVVDVATSDGDRWCASFDRRIPFRIAGELGLVEAISDAAAHRWRDADSAVFDDEDNFGELDRRRLDDWRSAARR